MTSLSLAIVNGHTDTVRVLVENGASLNAVDEVNILADAQTTTIKKLQHSGAQKIHIPYVTCLTDCLLPLLRIKRLSTKYLCVIKKIKNFIGNVLFTIKVTK
jgi:hypothetical protein